FSSRRRHTRWPRDWSSDVCSSDLDPAISNINDPSVRPWSNYYSRTLARQKPKQRLARLVAAMLTPLRLEHRPFDLVGLAAEFLDCVPDLFICQIRFLNLYRCHWSCSLALCIRRTVREPTIAPAMNPIISPKTLFMA